jgi:hypothetical protein
MSPVQPITITESSEIEESILDKISDAIEEISVKLGNPQRVEGGVVYGDRVRIQTKGRDIEQVLANTLASHFGCAIPIYDSPYGNSIEVMLDSTDWLAPSPRQQQPVAALPQPSTIAISDDGGATWHVTLDMQAGVKAR